MKKLFKVIISILVLIFSLINFSGCDLQELFHVHTFSEEWSYDEEYHWHENTCFHEEDVYLIDYDKHDFDRGIITVPATEEKEGLKVYTCKTCKKTKEEVIPVGTKSVGDIEFHFLTLGNKYAGDCIYVKAGDTDILIDAGSRANSVDTIREYVDGYCTDNILEYVIVTHADRDHIAGFAAKKGIFYYYKCQTIIDFPKSNSTTDTYDDYKTHRDEEVKNDGATHYTALDCYKEKNGAKRVYDFGDGVSMEILYNYYYENSSSDENNYSVCVLFRNGDDNFLFTGDLEKEGEEKLVRYNTLSEVELYKAGHHGSKTSSTYNLLNVIKPKICVVSCVAGTNEYTEAVENQFPTQDFIDRISSFTDKVYVTSLGDTAFTSGKNFVPFNGNVVVKSGSKGINVTCSYSDVMLKDSEWFKARRTTPNAWLNN